MKARAFRNPPLEKEPLPGASESILDGAAFAFLPRALTASNDHRCNVLAGVQETIAVALPLPVFGVERDARCERRARHLDASLDLIVTHRLERNGSVPGQGNTRCPGGGGTALANRRKKLLCQNRSISL